VERALAWGLAHILGVGFAAGAFLSMRARRRIGLVNRLVQQIEAGELRERLPVKGSKDPFDEFATLFNGMLDAQVRGLAGFGDQIALDLRTPPTHVRMVLERGREQATGRGQVRAVFDQAIMGLDQSLTIITALLRIAEIEHSRRLAGFEDVALAPLVRAAGELYEPIAEDKGVVLTVEASEEIVAWGDPDVLFEAIANLVDNAVKFTPQGGRVELKLCRAGNENVMHVRSRQRSGISSPDASIDRRRAVRSPGLG
jgi:signal transduction histidine kinase